MRAHFPEKPYIITKDMWDEYYEVQQSGRMNMMGHHLIGYFCQGDAYQQAKNHFVDNRTSDLVIE
tara:strand:- start:33419 stop:33613 length:195 start_codon:yes stop_codon:yes gene_type:complete